MTITVRKSTEADIAKLKNNPTWGCEISEFDWHYDSEEICWLTEGEVTVTYDGGGGRTKGPAKRTKEDNERFEAAFIKMLQV